MFAGHFDFEHPLLWTVDHVLTPAECDTLVDRAEAGHWFDATVNSFAGRVVKRDVRDSGTFVFDDERLAADLFTRIRPKIPERMMSMNASGVVSRLRVYRYREGQHFGLHQDQSYQGPNGARSLLTLMVYLNDDFEGGETDFPEQEQTIRPHTGMALLFQHMLLHEGRSIERGAKYVLRTDVLYTSGGQGLH